MIDIHDSEILAAERINKEIQSRVGTKHVDRDLLTQEIIEKYEAIGLRVVVKWWYSNVPGVLVPEVEIVDRLTPFDHDRQVHEVTDDILELGQGGVINTKKKPS